LPYSTLLWQINDDGDDDDGDDDEIFILLAMG